MRIQLLLLGVLVLLLTSCHSSKRLYCSAKGMEQTMLSAEEQRKYDYFFLEAVRLKSDKKYDAAFDLLKHCLAIQPQGAAALYEIAQYYMYLKLIPQGEAALEAAVENAPDNYWYSQALVNFYQGQNAQEKAISLLEAMSVRFPDRRESLFSLINLYGQQQKYSKVVSTLDRLEALLGKTEQLTMQKIGIYLQIKNNKKALQEIIGLVREYPLDLRYQVILGDVYMQSGKKQEAYDTYQKVLKAEPDNMLARLSLASYYEETDQPELYQQQVDSFLLSRSIPAEAKLEMMRQIIGQDEQTKADSTRVISLFDRVLELDDDDDQLPMLYAQYLWAKNLPDASIPVLERILRIDPTNKAARLMWLQVAIRKNDYQQVIRICEPGIEATPDALEFYFYLSIAYNQAQKTDEVIAICKKALERVNNGSDKKIVSDFYTLLGDGYHTKGLLKEAFSAYDSALVYNPSNIGVLNNYAYYLSTERRDLDRAEEMSYKTVKAEPDNATFLDTYAWILFEKGNYAEARIYIDNAMKSEEGYQSNVVVEHCGDIYYMTGDVDGAVKYWQQALDMGSESKTVKEKIKKKKYIAE